MRCTFPRKNLLLALAGLTTVAFLSSCNDPNVINKTTYNGQKVTNTCDQFKAEVNALIEANTAPTALRVAEDDNSGKGIVLEPGQLEVKGDTLYFKLIGDLVYAKYIDNKKGYAVQVKASYLAQDHLAELEKEPQGQIGQLIVNKAYYDMYKNDFVYKMAVPGNVVDGKQISLQFSIVQYDKAGKLKKSFCETDVTPLGPVDPPCCTDQPWSQVKPKSVVQMPVVQIKDELYKFKGFTGSLDLIHPMLKTTFDEKEIVNVIANYLGKYSAEGYNVSNIELASYASQGGTVELNQNLSEARAESVHAKLTEKFASEATAPKDVNFTKRGNGEDWDRFNLLVKTADFTEEERNQLLAISGSSQSLDEKEGELRKLKFWPKLIEEVLTYCRHTFVTFNFEYKGTNPVAEYYATQVPIISPELYTVATTNETIKQYQPGADVAKSTDILNKLIAANGQNANLFAMRSTYHFAKGDLPSAIKDIETAQGLDRANKDYAVAALSYKTEYAYNYSVSERVKLLNTYNDFVARYPDDQILLYNRAVLMDRIGFITGAEAEYTKIGDRNAIALNNKGVALLKTNRITEAGEAFLKATQLDAKLPHAHFNLGIVAAYQGKNAEATQHLDQAVALLPALKKDITGNPVFRNAAFNKYR